MNSEKLEISSIPPPPESLSRLVVILKAAQTARRAVFPNEADDE